MVSAPVNSDHAEIAITHFRNSGPHDGFHAAHRRGFWAGQHVVPFPNDNLRAAVAVDDRTVLCLGHRSRSLDREPNGGHDLLVALYRLDAGTLVVSKVFPRFVIQWSHKVSRARDAVFIFGSHGIARIDLISLDLTHAFNVVFLLNGSGHAEHHDSYFTIDRSITDRDARIFASEIAKQRWHDPSLTRLSITPCAELYELADGRVRFVNVDGQVLPRKDGEIVPRETSRQSLLTLDFASSQIQGFIFNEFPYAGRNVQSPLVVKPATYVVLPESYPYTSDNITLRVVGIDGVDLPPHRVRPRKDAAGKPIRIERACDDPFAAGYWLSYSDHAFGYVSHDGLPSALRLLPEGQAMFAFNADGESSITFAPDGTVKLAGRTGTEVLRRDLSNGAPGDLAAVRFEPNALQAAETDSNWVKFDRYSRLTQSISINAEDLSERACRAALETQVALLAKSLLQLMRGRVPDCLSFIYLTDSGQSLTEPAFFELAITRGYDLASPIRSLLSAYFDALEIAEWKRYQAIHLTPREWQHLPAMSSALRALLHMDSSGHELFRRYLAARDVESAGSYHVETLGYYATRYGWQDRAAIGFGVHFFLVIADGHFDGVPLAANGLLDAASTMLSDHDFAEVVKLETFKFATARAQAFGSNDVPERVQQHLQRITSQLDEKNLFQGEVRRLLSFKLSP